jgi:hypothetical protein
VTSRHRSRTAAAVGGIVVLSLHLAGAPAILATSRLIGGTLFVVLACAVALHVGIHVGIQRRRVTTEISRPPVETGQRSEVPPAGFEPAHTAPEADALSPELRGRGFGG